MADRSSARWGSTDEVGWVDATPFRAHLTHLMRAGSLSGGVVAQLTGVQPRAIRHLLYGRAGSPVRKISAETARRLLRVTTDDARQVRRRSVPAGTARRRLRTLLKAGCSRPELARAIGVDLSDLEELLALTTLSCTQLVSLQTAAVYADFRRRDDLLYTLAAAPQAA